jgi:hypothetical protein
MLARTHWCFNDSDYQGFIYSFIHSSVVLQPFAGSWPLLQFRNLFYTFGRTPWTSDQPITRPLPTHMSTQTQTHT